MATARASMGSSFFFTNRSSIILVLAILTTIFSAATHQVAGKPPSVVPSACQEAYAVGGGTFTVDFCLSALTGKSVGATDYADLVLVAVDLATASATATEAKIDGLLRGNGGSSAGAVSEGLESCRALYGAVVQQYQPECRAAVKGRRYGDGKSCLSRTAKAAGECERSFQQRKVASPLAREDEDLAKLANLAIALASIA